MNSIEVNTSERLLGTQGDDPEAKKDDETTKEKEKEEEKEEERSVWRDFIDIDFYELFKMLSPLIPTFPSVYAILIAMFRDQSTGTLANWYKIMEFIENLNLCLYSIAAAIFYKLFKRKKKKEDPVRMKLALTIEKLNKYFLGYCFLIAGAKLVLGIILPSVDGVPDDQTVGLFIFSLFSKLGLILAQLFYLYTVYVKKYYKALPIILDAVDNGSLDDSNKIVEDPDAKPKNNRLKHAKKIVNEQKNGEVAKKRKPHGQKKNQVIQVLKRDDEEVVKRRKPGVQKKNQEEEAIQVLKRDYEKVAEKNERLLVVVENLSDANKNCSDLKEEFSDLKKLNFILLKFAKPLLEDIQLKISDQIENGGKSLLVTAKVTDRVQDVKYHIRRQLNLPENAKKLVFTTNQGEELKDDDFIGDNQELKLTYEP